MVSRKSLITSTPKITVILPVYNAERFLRQTLASVLTQSFTNFELIIIDDCSKDGSWKIIQEYKKKDKRIVASRNKKNIGGCATLNEGLKIARGKYVARVDNDDISKPDRFKKQWEFLESHTKVGIVGGTMEIISEEGEKIGKRSYHNSDREIRNHIFQYSPFSHPLVMIRKEILDQVGYYNPVFAPADDYELYFRIGQKAKFANLSDVLLQYRIVKGSMTNNLTKKMELTTIAVRWKYARDPNYHMSIIDRLMTSLQYLSIYIIPSRWKVWLFQKMRNTA